MRVSHKILLPNFLLLLLLLSIMLYVVSTLRNEAVVLDLSLNQLRQIESILSRLDNAHGASELSTLSYAAVQDELFLHRIKRAEEEVTLTLEKLHQIIPSKRGKSLLITFSLKRNGIEDLRNEFIESIRFQNEERIRQVFLKWSIKTRQINAAKADIKAFSIHIINKAINDIEENRNQISILIAVSFVFLLFAIFASFYYAHYLLSKPIEALDRLSQKYARGEFKSEISRHLANSNDEFGTLAKSFHSMAKELDDTTISRDIHAIATKEAKSASIAKSEFLASMSHEIRTPLNGVLGMAQHLNDTELDADQKTKVEIIIQSGEILLGIINNVLDMSKIESSHIQLESRPINLKKLAKKVIAPMQESRDSYKIIPTINLSGLNASMVIGDPLRLTQVLCNLLNNAQKFTDTGNISLVISDELNSSTNQTNEPLKTVSFSIIDSGIGIAPENIEKIFSSFSQEDNTISRKYGGSGLGLAIVKRLVEMMGGDIVVSSIVGKGSTFKVSIPFQLSSNEILSGQPLKNSTPKVEMLKQQNILVAEDNMINAMVIKAFLEKLGHQLKLVVNGIQAIQASSEQEFDLIFMDIQMPEMDGIEATKNIRNSNSNPKSKNLNTPIVALTADAFSDQSEAFFEAGMDGILTKPYKEKQLRETLAKYCHRQSQQEQKETKK